MARISSAQSLKTLAWASLLAASLACAGAPPSSWTAEHGRRGAPTAGPGAVFSSVREAALDALVTARRTATPRDEERLRVGTIHRVAQGYSYAAPQRAVASSARMPQSIRYQLRPADVASYLIPPRATTWPRDRSVDALLAEAQRIVDDLDPAHRPVYVLTDALEVVRYTGGGQPHAVARLGTPR